MPIFRFTGVYEFATDSRATPGCNRPVSKDFPAINEEEAWEMVDAYYKDRPELKKRKLVKVEEEKCHPEAVS